MLKVLCRWLLVGFLFAPASVLCQDIPSAAAQLAARITERSTPGAVSIAITNRSSLSDDAVTTLRSELLQQLQARGWRAKSSTEGGTTINITLAESFRNYVWTAEIFEGEVRKVAILEMPRPRLATESTSDPVVLARTLLISSDEPLLDVALVEGKISEGAHLTALTRSSVQLFQMQSGQWHLTQTQPLGIAPGGSRDLRGRLFIQQGSIIDAYLPALHCTGVITQTLSITCRQSDDPWPVGEDRRLEAFYASTRNYFNGILSGQSAQNGTVNPFYSAAVLSDRVLYSGIDGRVRSRVNGQTSAIPAAKWGSNIAAVQSTCIRDIVIAGSQGDFTQSDAATAYAVSNSELTPVAQPAPFPGPIINLNPSPGGQQAVAVVSSLSGRYEAYLLTPRCNY
ncbi:MAG TPA: hypothetical protein VFU50_13055 [Terriglobales bacterium]|nr:hypothetical protein [Terriglobales bacterium]